MAEYKVDDLPSLEAHRLCSDVNLMMATNHSIDGTEYLPEEAETCEYSYDVSYDPTGPRFIVSVERIVKYAHGNESAAAWARFMVRNRDETWLLVDIDRDETTGYRIDQDLKDAIYTLGAATSAAVN